MKIGNDAILIQEGSMSDKSNEINKIHDDNQLTLFTAVKDSVENLTRRGL